jgi:hypothetical protein
MLSEIAGCAACAPILDLFSNHVPSQDGTHLFTGKPTGFWLSRHIVVWPFIHELNTKWLLLPRWLVSTPICILEGSLIRGNVKKMFTGPRQHWIERSSNPHWVQPNTTGRGGRVLTWIGWFVDASWQKSDLPDGFFQHYSENRGVHNEPILVPARPPPVEQIVTGRELKWATIRYPPPFFLNLG